MNRAELEHSTQDGLSRIAHIAEGTSKVTLALTGLASGLISVADVARLKFPKKGLLVTGVGVSIAVGSKVISAVCDLGVDAINNRNGLS